MRPLSALRSQPRRIEGPAVELLSLSGEISLDEDGVEPAGVSGVVGDPTGAVWAGRFARGEIRSASRSRPFWKSSWWRRRKTGESPSNPGTRAMRARSRGLLSRLTARWSSGSQMRFSVSTMNNVRVPV